jgi:chaperone required for assembly of F1-ATPase
VSWAPRRRFWASAGVRPEAGGFAVALDARLLRTPGGVALRVPTEALAAAIAAEWDAVEGEIDPRRLPLTRLANSAIDRVEPQRAAVVAAIAEYGATDLVCYRAERPEALAARQAAAWDPWLLWSRRSLGAPLIAVGGVMHRAQPPASLAALGRAVAAEGAFGLVALHDLVTLSGSLVLGLAVRRGALAPAAAWELSRVDEDWQAEQWGLDAEAEAAAAAGREAFMEAARFSGLLG